MDLKAILAANKAKTERANLTRKPVEIADQDRPYSIHDAAETTPAKESSTATPKEEKTLSMSEQGISHTAITTPYPVVESLVKPAPELPIETGNKVETNRQQTDNKVATNRKQTDNKPITKSVQPVNKPVNENRNWQQSGNATGNKVTTELTTNRQQSGNKLATTITFSELVGLQREIVIFICHECKNSRSRVTEALTLEHMATALKHSTGAIKTTIQRLEKKGCLKRVGFKNGRGGWSRYELPDDIYHAVLRTETGNKLTTKWQQTDNKVASQPTTEPATSASSSSSSFKDIKTTTTELGDEWNFDITPYNRFGFTSSQLKQLATLGTILAADVEQSLIEFSCDYDNNALPPIKTSKINFLMGLLRAGHTYVSEAYKNEQQAAIKEMARRANEKRESLLKSKFEAWEALLNDEQRKNIETEMPTNVIVLNRVHGVSNPDVRNWMFNYYLENYSV